MVNILDSILNKDILLSLIRFGAGFALVLGIGSWIRAKKQIDYLVSSALILTAIFQFVDEFSLSMVSPTWLRKSLFFNRYRSVSRQRNTCIFNFNDEFQEVLKTSFDLLLKSFRSVHP